MDSRIFRQLFVIPENLIGAAVVLNNDDLIILVGSLRKDGFHTFLKCLFLFSVRYDNGYQRFSLYRILHTEESEIRGMLHSSLRPCPFKVTLNSAPASFKCIHLACRIICRRRFMGTPVI